MDRYEKFYKKFKEEYAVPEPHKIIQSVADTPLWLRKFFEEQGKKEVAKEIFKELEKYFINEKNNEDSYIIFSADYFLIKSKFLGSEKR